MAARELQARIRHQEDEIMSKNQTIQTLMDKIASLDKEITQLDEQSLQENQSSQKLADGVNAPELLDDLFLVLSAIHRLKLILNEGKPLDVKKEIWSQMDTKKKWIMMFQATEKNSAVNPIVSKYLERARAATSDAAVFSQAMIDLSFRLNRRIWGFTQTGNIFADGFLNNLRNELYQGLLLSNNN